MVYCNAIVAPNAYIKNNIGKLVPNYKFYDQDFHSLMPHRRLVYYIIDTIFSIFYQALLLDPSQVHRPEPAFEEYNAFHNLKPGEALDNIGREKETFRDFNVDESMMHVRDTYRNMHTQQTVASGKDMVCEIKKNWFSLAGSQERLFPCYFTVKPVLYVEFHSHSPD